MTTTFGSKNAARARMPEPTDKKRRGLIRWPRRAAFRSRRASEPEAKAIYSIPSREREVFEASLLATFARILQWAYPLSYYFSSAVWDWLRGRRDMPQRAMRIRIALEKMGGTFVKVGQQLSTRLDLLPTEVCVELSKLLDDMPAFPTSQAIEAIERTTGRPLDEAFSKFNRNPIGSASVACVYYGVLHNGKEVAVKVRRPNIGKVFAADLRALDLICQFLEGLAIIRPGVTQVIRSELRTMLMEELDFRSEARYQELFRRQAKRDKQRHVTAPKVHYDYCGREVITSDFVRGVWLTKFLAAKESNDERLLEHWRDQLKLSPKKVARRLLRTLHWSFHENLFYHADPHPANIVLQKKNKLMFVDFGACGPTTNRHRRNFVELYRRQGNKDIDGMIHVFDGLLSPFPQFDLKSFNRYGETELWRWIYGLESKHGEWWEHTSAGLWIRMFEATRKFNIPVNIETVRLMRATLLYDTVAARLDRNINMQREFDRYEAEAQQRAITRVAKRLQKQSSPGRMMLQFERIAQLLGRLLYKVEEFADEPSPPFYAAIQKGAYSLSVYLQTTLFLATAFIGGIAVIRVKDYFLELTSPPLSDMSYQVAGHPIFWVILAICLLRTYRSVQFRLRDVDTQDGSRTRRTII